MKVISLIAVSLAAFALLDFTSAQMISPGLPPFMPGGMFFPGLMGPLGPFGLGMLGGLGMGSFGPMGGFGLFGRARLFGPRGRRDADDRKFILFMISIRRNPKKYNIYFQLF